MTKYREYTITGWKADVFIVVPMLMGYIHIARWLWNLAFGD